MSRRSFSNCVIVVRVREPCATARQPRETTVQLRREPVEVIVSKLVNGDQDDERRRAGAAAICFGRGLGARSAAAQYPEEQ